MSVHREKGECRRISLPTACACCVVYLIMCVVACCVDRAYEMEVREQKRGVESSESASFFRTHSARIRPSRDDEEGTEGGGSGTTGVVLSLSSLPPLFPPLHLLTRRVELEFTAMNTTEQSIVVSFNGHSRRQVVAAM